MRRTAEPGAGGWPSTGVAAYAAGSLLLVLAGIVGAAWLRLAPLATLAVAALAAWMIQAMAVWRVVAALDAGRSVMGPWVAGIGARVGGLVAAFVAAWLSPRTGDELPLAYGATLLILLLLEAGWLARRAARRPGPTA